MLAPLLTDALINDVPPSGSLLIIGLFPSTCWASPKSACAWATCCRHARALRLFSHRRMAGKAVLMDAREYLVPIPPLERWKLDAAARPTPFTDGLCADAPEGAPCACSCCPSRSFAPRRRRRRSPPVTLPRKRSEHVKANCARPAFRLPLSPSSPVTASAGAAATALSPSRAWAPASPSKRRGAGKRPAPRMDGRTAAGRGLQRSRPLPARACPFRRDGAAYASIPPRCARWRRKRPAHARRRPWR